MRNHPLIALTISMLLASGVALGRTPPVNRISEEKAQAVALKQAMGTVEKHELEFENGKWIYSFDIRAADKLIHEVQIDATTGKIVSNKTETPADEAAEAAADSRKK